MGQFRVNASQMLENNYICVTDAKPYCLRTGILTERGEKKRKRVSLSISFSKITHKAM